jgi:hypothetical protein
MLMVLQNFVKQGAFFFSHSLKHLRYTFCRGIRLVYLPPYSPDFNPIEEMFSWLKAYIWRHGVQYRSLLENSDLLQARLFLYHALDLVEPVCIEGWFSHAGYF